MYKLKHNNGTVNILIKSGKDFVRGTASLEFSQKVIENGNLMESDRADYPICVDGEWYFEGEETKRKGK